MIYLEIKKNEITILYFKTNVTNFSSIQTFSL